jgi:deaminated glutathione amidase
VKPFGIAGLQLPVSGKESNLPLLEEKLDHLTALFPWVEMAVFSELAAYGPSTGKAEPLPGPAEEAFQAMAKKHRVWILNGSLYERTRRGIFNTTSVIDPTGEVVGRHRKLFPFRPYEVGVEAGDDFLVFDVPRVGRFGVSICYDAWFPETSRTLAAMGAEVILHPSLTPTIDRDVELAIARATAATNQCYFVDINGLGAGGNGRSIVVGPDGDVLHQAGSGEELIPFEIDLTRVRRSREAGLRGLGQPLKSFQHRKVRFRVYDPRWKGAEYLRSLDPPEKPDRPGRKGSVKRRS